MQYWKEEIYHHGILGMRWGQRNGPPYPLSPKKHSVVKKKASEIKARYKKNKEILKEKNKENKLTTRERARKTNPSTLTSEQMRADINRINLENEYRRASYTEVEKMIRDVGKNSVKTILQTTLISLGNKYVKGVIEKNIDEVIEKRK